MQKFHTALITGASSGIGEALAYLLAEKGINLIISGRNLPRLEQLARNITNVNVQIFPADLTLPDQRPALVKLIQTEVPDLIINNAGLGKYGEAIEGSTQSQLEILTLNGLSVLDLSIEGAKALRKNGKHGTILNVSSVAGFFAFPLFAVYASSKAFVTSFSQAFDDEMSPYGIRILASCPGPVQTLFRSRAGGTPAESSDAMAAEFAAKEIWWQIQKGKKVHIFDWKYRFLTFLRHFIPKPILAKILRTSIEKRIANAHI